MAAHILNVLKNDCLTGKTSPYILRSGLGYALFGDQLEGGYDWQLLYYAESVQEIQYIASILIDKYTKLWNLLGKPRTAEDWNQARYYGLKTRRKGNYRKIAHKDSLSFWDYDDSKWKEYNS